MMACTPAAVTANVLLAGLLTGTEWTLAVIV
jgi:hypothetical protein